MKYIASYNESEWYRGHTTNTRPSNFVWMSSDKNQAKTYSDMNKVIQGGDALLSEYSVDLDKLNLLDLSEYDMNDRLEGYEIDELLDEIGIEYEYEDLFDFTEDDIPLSRLINSILKDIMSSFDALLVKEDGIDTILIKRELI